MEIISIPTPNFPIRPPPPHPAGLGPARLQSRPFGPSFRPPTDARLPERRRRLAAAHFSFRREPHGSEFGGGGGGGGVVDENMIVLRKRIGEMEMAERNYEPPAEWTEWEKRYYTSYGADVCEFAGLLQALLMSTRPGLGLGMLGLVVLSVPIAAGTAVCHLIDISQLILSKVH